MEWVPILKDLWWLWATLFGILGALWKLAINTNKSKERLTQVATNKEAIDAIKTEVSEMKDDISDIKEGQARQNRDTAAMFSILQGVLVALSGKDCDISGTQSRLNEYLAKR